MDEGDLGCSSCGRRWPVRGGIPNLVFPEQLQGEEAHARDFWNRVARFWGSICLLTNIMRGERGSKERHELIERLDLRPGDGVLEVAAGAGANLKIIAERMGEQVAVFGLDLSSRMLSFAARNLGPLPRPPHLVLGNAVFLPFADEVFSAALDGAGIKYYSDKGRAVRELLRVVKPGGKVLIWDVGLPPGKRLTFRQRLLALWIPGFREGPPLDAIPSGVSDLKVDWDRRETLYTIEFRKTAS